MDITQSSDIKELFSKLLVTKNKLKLIEDYYTNLGANLTGDLDELYHKLIDEKLWMQNQIGAITSKQSDLQTAVNKFTSMSDEKDFVGHAKYLEMLNLYNRYISEFYNRMTKLEGTFEDSFFKSEINDINLTWKFHYGEDRTDAIPMKHEFSSVNLTKDSDIVEISDGRYIYVTNNSYIVDADYKSKNCYITALDGKTIFNRFVQTSGSAKGFYGEENAKIIKLFRLKGKKEIFVLIDLFTVEDASMLSGKGEIVGAESDGIIHGVVFGKYDWNTKTISPLLEEDRTTVLYIRDALIQNYELEFIKEPYTDFYYYYLSKYICRVKVLGSSNEKLAHKLMLISHVDICAAIISGRFLITPVDDKKIETYELNKEVLDMSNPYKSFSTESLRNQFEQGEQGIVCNIQNTADSGLFFMTDKSIWNTDNKGHDYFEFVTKDDRTKLISESLNYTNKKSYTFDDNGYFYYLSDVNVYLVKNDVEGKDAVVMSPTRFSDRLFFVKSEAISETVGYAYNKPELEKPNPVLDGENVMTSFVYDGYYVAISSSGKVSRCNIEQGKWISNINPIVSNKTILACYVDDNKIYFATTSGSAGTPGIYTITKKELIGSNLDVKAVKFQEAIIDTVGSIYAITKFEDTLYLGGFGGRVSAFDLKSKKFYRYDDETNEKCTNVGDALGNKTIKHMCIAGAILIVMGEEGRVASCSLVSKTWTSFQGSPIGGDEIDAKIYNDGTALHNEPINTFANYLNESLIILGNHGKVAECDLVTGIWKECDSGRGVSNKGDFVNYDNITSSIRLNNILILGTELGYLASINLDTGGITTYKGKSYDVNRTGPGIYYDGADFPAVTSITVDNLKGLIIFGGKESYVYSYSLMERLVLKPDLSKLYYVGRGMTDNDYLSSLLVQISTESLDEVKVLEPPREPNVIYTTTLNNSFYTFKNGNYLYRLTNDFRQLYKSTDGGSTTEILDIVNSGWVPSSKGLNEPIGYVTGDGEFGFFVEVNKIPYFLFTSKDNGISKASWYSPSTYNTEDTIKYFGLATDNKNSLFYVNIENKNGALIPAVLKFSTNNTLVDLTYEFKLSSDINLEDETRNIYLSILKDGKVAVTSDYSLAVTEYTMDQYGLNYKISDLIHPVSLFKDDSTKFFNKYFENKNQLGYLSENGGRFLGFYTIDNFVYNYIFGNTNSGDIDIVNVVAFKKDSIIDVSNKQSLINRTAWDVIDNIIKPSQYIPIYGNTRYTTKTDVNLSNITFNPKYLLSFDNGYNGALGVDVTYLTNENTEVSKNGGYTKSHVVISLNNSRFGKYISTDYRVFKVIENFGHLVCKDDATKDFLVNEYSYLNEHGRIRFSNAVHKFEIVNSLANTPLRSLQDSWYGTQIYLTANDINAFTIKCKLCVVGDDKEIDTVIRQEAIRYQVLISSETTGKFILYEVEKSPIMSRTDRETKSFCPLFKVKAIDRFDGRISELFSSRLSGRQSSFFRVQPNDPNYPDNYLTKTMTTYDFMSYIDMSRTLSEIENDVVSVRIKPLNTLPSSIDAQFYIETYNLPLGNDVESRTESVKNGFNNIERSEYKDEFALSGLSIINIGIPNSKGFLEKSAPDIVNKTDKLHTFNNADLPQVNGKPLNLERGNADTYCVRFMGNGDGTYNSTTGIIMHTGGGEWKFTPYAVNKKRIRYEFDEVGSKHIANNFNLKYCRAGRNLHKMHNFGIYAKSVINNADYYTSYGTNGDSRIAKCEGKFATYYGLFEVVSTFDGYQRRMSKVLENSENGLYRVIKNAYDNINDRKFGMAYDIVDRYSIFELPYYYNQSWWIPAKGYITRGNESLLTFDADESEAHYRNIGRYRLPFSDITTPEKEIGGSSGDQGGGIGSGGQAYDPNKVAYSTLMAEKYPLEHWEGFNDLDFVRKWKDTYTGGNEKLRWVVEKPKIDGNSQFFTYDEVPTAESPTNPTVPRNLYYYNDNFDWERRGVQVRKYMTGYYYDSYNWKIYKHEIITDTYGYDSKYNGVDENYTMDKNLSKLLSTDITEEAWYVPVTNNHNNEKYFIEKYIVKNTVKPTDECVEYWPRPDKFVVGEKIDTLTSPIPDLVAINDGTAAYTKYTSATESVYPKCKLMVYRRGKLEKQVDIDPGTTPDLPGTNLFGAITVSADADNVLTTSNSGVNSDEVNSILANAGNNAVAIGASSVNTGNLPAYKDQFARYGIVFSGEDNGRIPRIFNGYVGASNQFALSGKTNTYGYDNNVGLIYPFKFKNKSWNVTNWDTPFSAVTTKYYADCSTTTVTITPTITAGAKLYDRYAGGDQFNWHYGTEEDVVFSVEGMTPKTFSKRYYKYTTEGSSYGPTANTKAIPIYWDVRVPTNSKDASVVVDKEFLRLEGELDKKYYFRSYYDDGHYADTVETISYIYKWIYIAPNATFTPYGLDASSKNDCKITCREYYEWADGNIKYYDKDYTLGYLNTEWKVSSEYTVTTGSNGSNYVKKYNINFTGPSLSDQKWSGSSRTVPISKTVNILYAKDIGNAGSAGTSAVKWNSPDGIK